MSKHKIKILAYYLPQYHQIPENDEWWGEGFTEWTNVGKAKPLYKMHYQPRVPAHLGYYDLRLPEIRNKQAELAKEAGVSAFCYWHYWFGGGKQLLEMPLNEVVKSKSPDFPFCIAWANHSWERKRWNADANKLLKDLLIKQSYGGDEDVIAHFYSLLPAFKDSRYFCINGKLVFVIYQVGDIPDFKRFVYLWQELAEKNGLPPFYFIGHAFSINELNNTPALKYCDATNLILLKDTFNSKLNILKLLFSYITKRPLLVREYKDAVKVLKNPIFKEDKVIPTILPNWDASPRLGSVATILNNSTPASFYRHVIDVFDLIKNKEQEDRIVFLKSWNEWAEGNYMEPDIKYGKQYIEQLRKALNDYDISNLSDFE